MVFVDTMPVLPWAIMAACGLLLLAVKKVGGIHFALVMAVCAFWIAAAFMTGDRRLFFPYSMFLAAAVMVPAGVEGRAEALLRGMGMVALFLLIRRLQGASGSVLFVETVVAMVAMTPVYLSARRFDGLQTLMMPSLAALISILGLQF